MSAVTAILDANLNVMGSTPIIPAMNLEYSSVGRALEL